MIFRRLKLTATPGPGRRLLAGLCLALILTLNLLAASPALHHALHPDAGQPDHHCGVTLFAHGVSTADGAILVPEAAWHALPESAPAVAELLLTAPRYRLLPGRGPPAA